MATVTKKELAYRIAEKCDQKKVVVKRIIQEFIDEIIEELASGNRLEFREFGVFEMKTRAARKARNPRTGVRVDVPSKAVVHFKAGRAMKDRVQRAADEGLVPATPPRAHGISRSPAAADAGRAHRAVDLPARAPNPAAAEGNSSVAADL
jgi:integration host factor subunit beta